MRLPLKSPRRTLATALLVAMLLPGAAFAQTAKERELEARIAQLETQVQALLGTQQQQQMSLAQAQTTIEEVRVAQAANDAKPNGQTTPILATGNPGGRFSFGGFIKLDAMYTDTNGAVDMQMPRDHPGADRSRLRGRGQG